jgi:hypothetical protein
MAALSGPWEVSFPPNLGAPAKIQLQKLEPWTANQDDGVKYFSGTATYTKSVEVPPTWFRPEAKILLDLGMVKDLAEVSVNGKTLGTWWKPPYQVDLTGVLKPGANQLEIKVTNEWTNRQMGDRLAPVEKRVLATAGVMMGGSGRGHHSLAPFSQLRVADLRHHNLFFLLTRFWWSCYDSSWVGLSFVNCTFRVHRS